MTPREELPGNGKSAHIMKCVDGAKNLTKNESVLQFLLAFTQVWDPVSPARMEGVLRQALELKAGESGGAGVAYAGAMAQFARFLERGGRKPEAAEWLDRALAIRESADDFELLAELGGRDPLPLLERAAAIREKEGKPAPWARTLHRIGSVLEERRDLPGAESVYRRALALVDQTVSPELAVICNDLGLLMENQEKMAAAEGLYRRALAVHEKVHGPRHPEVGITLNNLAGVTGAQGRLAEAEVLLKRALAVLESSLGPAHERTVAAAANLGDLMEALGRPADARKYRQRVKAK